MYKLLSLIYFLSLATNLSAANFVVHLDEIFTEQNYLKTLTIEAVNLNGHAILNNGQAFEKASDAEWPEISELQEITLEGPEVNLILETCQGGIWERSIESFHFQLLKTFNEEHSQIAMDFHGNPVLAGTASSSEALFTFSQYLMKNLFLNASGEIHLNLQASSAIQQPNSIFQALFEMGKQKLAITLNDLGAEKNGSWALQSHTLGKEALLDILVVAMKGMYQTSKDITPKDPYEELVKNFFEQIDYGMQVLSPLCDWKGVWLLIDGDFNYQQVNDADLMVRINNLFKVETYDKSWQSSIGLRSFFHRVNGSPTAWKQEVLIKNPSEDLEKICDWLQINCLDQLAILLDMPSITYYGSYFPTYFKAALFKLMTALGQTQESDSLIFTASGNGSEVDTFCEANPSEIGQNFIQSIKDKIGSWFN